MTNLGSWVKFQKSRVRCPPLAFVTGMWLRVFRGVCCAVHSHREIEMVYHLSGRGVTRLGDGSEIPFAPGSAVLYAPNVLHDQVMEEDGEELCVQIAVPLGIRSRPLSALHIEKISSTAFVDTVKTLSRGFSGLSDAKQLILDLKASTILMEVIQFACVHHEQRTLPVGERHVVKAELYIAEYFREIHSIGEVASKVGISQDYLRHLFKELRGKSLIRHLNEVRIDQAKILLTRSICPLKQISMLCGFADEYYFSVVFRKITGVTAYWYRRNSDGFLIEKNMSYTVNSAAVTSGPLKRD